MAFKQLWHRASHIGVEEATPPRLARYVVLLNTVMLLASPISIVYLARDDGYDFFADRLERERGESLEMVVHVSEEHIDH